MHTRAPPLPSGLSLSLSPPPTVRYLQTAPQIIYQIQVHRIAVILHELGRRQQQCRVVAAELHDQGPVLGVRIKVALAVRSACETAGIKKVVGRTVCGGLWRYQLATCKILPNTEVRKSD